MLNSNKKPTKVFLVVLVMGDERFKREGEPDMKKV